jgi:hypothetical protein
MKTLHLTGLAFAIATEFALLLAGSAEAFCWYDGSWHGPGWYWCGYV